MKEKIFFSFGLLIPAALLFFLPKVFSEHYVAQQTAQVFTATSTEIITPKVFVPTHVATPDAVKGIYMTSWVAGTPSLRNGLVKLLDETEVNSGVIDIKDYSGKIVFPVTNPELKAYGSEEVRISDLPQFIDMLHKKGVYVIGRVAVFQDAYFVKLRPDLAVKNKSGTATWKDRKGISWIDAGSREYWDYIILLAEESHNIGFDEINFDYIRFPSDGNMQDISYPWSTTTPKAKVLKDFFQYLHEHLVSPRQRLGAEIDSKSLGVASGNADRLKTSADLFGMVTTAGDDMGIGQVLENALPYFDYISPMVYPSHYPATFQGFQNPEAHPYEVVQFAMQEGERRAEKFASTTGETVAELRPWLQDFGLKQTYGSAEVRAQIKATYDVGLDSWLLWSASNKYTRGALDVQ